MKRPAVRCRCGHQVLAKEVLRTDLYERPSGREYVYVKYRCKRCKRVGETFVAENRWDWRIFEAPQSEMSESEMDTFADKAPITSEDLLDFHCHLESISTATELALSNDQLHLKTSEEISSTESSEGAASTDKVEESLEAPLESSPEIKADVTPKHSRIEPKRGDFKSANDGLKSNPDPEGKKENKKDVGKTGGPDDGIAR